MIVSSKNTSPYKIEAEVLDQYIYKVAGGDKDALGSLYNDTKASIYGFALSIVKNPVEAEDILQDVYVNIYGGAKTYKSNGKPMAWMLTITRNLALMRIREQKKALLLSSEEMSDVYQPTVTDEDHMVLQAILGDLKDEERQIVILHSLTGLKHREIATLLEMPLSTVLSKYNRAIKKLKKILKEEI